MAGHVEFELRRETGKEYLVKAVPAQPLGKWMRANWRVCSANLLLPNGTRHYSGNGTAAMVWRKLVALCNALSKSGKGAAI